MLHTVRKWARCLQILKLPAAWLASTTIYKKVSFKPCMIIVRIAVRTVVHKSVTLTSLQVWGIISRAADWQQTSKVSTLKKLRPNSKICSAKSGTSDHSAKITSDPWCTPFSSCRWIHRAPTTNPESFMNSLRTWLIKTSWCQMALRSSSWNSLFGEFTTHGSMFWKTSNGYLIADGIGSDTFMNVIQVCKLWHIDSGIRRPIDWSSKKRRSSTNHPSLCWKSVLEVVYAEMYREIIVKSDNLQHTACRCFVCRSQCRHAGTFHLKSNCLQFLINPYYN